MYEQNSPYLLFSLLGILMILSRVAKLENSSKFRVGYTLVLHPYFHRYEIVN